MGHVISATCKCGYKESDLRIGSGRSDFSTNCSHPAICKAGKHVVTVNLKAGSLACPDGCSERPDPYFCTSNLQINPGSNLILISPDPQP